MTKEQFLSFYANDPIANDCATCYDMITAALQQQGILTDLTLIGMLATIRVETSKTFRPIPEYASGAEYQWRRDLGNTNAGDGMKYKGRGYIQITGRVNYESYGKRLGIDLISNPNLALDPATSAKIAAMYFKDRGVDKACNARQWQSVRQLVNGGLNGYTLFISVVNQYLKFHS